MYPRPFEYRAVTTVDEALRVLHEVEDGKVLAGGQSLLPLMKLRLASPGVLVDISGIPDLSYIRPQGENAVEIGSLATHDTVAHSALLQERCPILPAAARGIADQQIRNRGTIGGSSCHADPASDLPPTLLALDAEFSIVGPKGSRTVPAKEFFVDLFETQVQRDEILHHIQVPTLGPQWGWSYAKFNRREGDYPIVGVAILVRLDSHGRRLEEVRIGLAAVNPTPCRARAAERFLQGQEISPAILKEAAHRSTEGLHPGSDMHGSSQYRRDMVQVFVRRGLEEAVTRARLAGGNP